MFFHQNLIQVENGFSIDLPPPLVPRELPTKKTKSTASFDSYLSLGRPFFVKCIAAKRHNVNISPYHFVLHGLWPSDRHGAHPSFCSAQRIDPTTLQAMLSMMPDKNLIKHEWRKHGTCSDLTPKEYFDLAKKATMRSNSQTFL